MYANIETTMVVGGFCGRWRVGFYRNMAPCSYFLSKGCNGFLPRLSCSSLKMPITWVDTFIPYGGTVKSCNVAYGDSPLKNARPWSRVDLDVKTAIFCVGIPIEKGAKMKRQ